MAWPRAPLIIPLCVVFVLVALLCLIFFKLIQILTRRPNKRESYEVEKGVYEEGAMTTLSRRGRQKPQGLIPYTIDPGSSSSNIVKRSASPLYPAVLTGAAVLGGMATGAALRTTINGSDEEEDERAGRNQADERYTDLDTVDEATEDAAGIVQFLGEPSSSSSQHHQASSYSMRTMDMNTTNSSASTEAHYNNRHEVAYDTHYYGGASSGAGDHYESDV